MNVSTYGHFFAHSLRMRLDRFHRVPLSMNIQLTNQCASHCLYCEYDRDQPNRLSLDLLSKVLEEAREMGTRRINLTGGEPLLRDDLDEITRQVKELGMFLSMATSGVNLEAQTSAVRRCDKVMLSFDGPYEVRSRLCGPDCAGAAEAALELLPSMGVSFWTTSVLNRLNIPWIDWIVENARSRGIQSNFVLLQVQACSGPGSHPRLSKVADLMPEQDETRRALRRLVELKRSGAPVGSSMSYLLEQLGWSDYRRIRRPERSRAYECLAGRAFCELLANGTLTGCDWTLDEVPGVSVVDHGFRDAFARLPHLPDCRSCVSSCELEMNLLFNLNLGSIFNWLRRI